MLRPLRCPRCDGSDTPASQVMPSHITAYVDGVILGEPMSLGEWSTAVTGPNSPPYAVTLSREAAETQERAILEFETWPPSAFEAFATAYVRDTVEKNRLDDIWRRWTPRQWSDAFVAAGIPQPSRPSAYKAEARNHVEPILSTYLRKAIADVQFLSLPVWAERVATRLDPWTAQYLVLYVPLPETLEDMRTELIGRFVRKSSVHGNAALFGRLRDVQAALDEQRAKSRRLLEQLSEQRREIAERDSRLATAYARIRTLEDQLARQSAEQTAEPRDMAKRAQWKALVADLRAEVARLERTLDRSQAHPIDWLTEQDSDDPTPPCQEVFDLQGKTVLIVGGPWAQFPDGEYPCAILHHDGHREEGLEAALNAADIAVIVTSHISHNSYWRVREEAADRGIPLGFTTATNPSRILDLASRIG